ncbi:GNAT family N-acetyltransferase [soil metagenome]
MDLVLETERLNLRQFELQDAEFIISLLNSPGWLKYIGDRNVKTTEEAELYLLNGPMNSFKVNGFGLAMVELKDSNVPIGMCGLIRRDYLQLPDIGFALLSEYMGMSYGFEIAKATLDYALHELKLPGILAITLPDNVQSIKLIERIGMSFVKNIIVPDDNEELMLFST